MPQWAPAAAVGAVLLACVALAVATLVQAAQLRRATEAVEKQVYSAEAQADRRPALLVSNAVRAYALVLRPALAADLNGAVGAPRFRDLRLATCGATGSRMRAVRYTSTTWLAAENTRSAGALRADAGQGAALYVLFRGRVCRIRAPSRAETQRLRERHPHAGDVALFVLADAQAVAFEDEDGDGGGSDGGDDDCALPTEYALQPNGSGGSSMVGEMRALAARADVARAGELFAHLWGYATSANEEAVRAASDDVRRRRTDADGGSSRGGGRVQAKAHGWMPE